MRRAFTLLELLVVVAIMGILGTFAIAGYTAVTRGMAERGALKAMEGLLEAARHRANISHCRTHVFFYTEVVAPDTEDDVSQVCGLAIAVKEEGRISLADKGKLYDEFGDADLALSQLTGDYQNLSESDLDRLAGTVRLYNLANGDFIDAKTTAVSTGQEVDLEDCANLAAANGGYLNPGQWPSPRTYAMCGYQVKSGNANFKAGDAYGKEFARIRLPNGYTFEKGAGRYALSDVGVKTPAIRQIDFEMTDRSRKTVPIYRRNADRSFDQVKARD